MEGLGPGLGLGGGWLGRAGGMGREAACEKGQGEGFGVGEAWGRLRV